MHSVIAETYKTGTVEGQSGKLLPLHSAIDPEEGEFIQSIIKADESIRNTVEVGCAYGLSTLFICEILQSRQGTKHTVIDPYQSTQWDGAALVALARAGFSNFELIEEKSEFALPLLVRQAEGQIDLVLVDGWHTFDHTLIDCFYATRLLKTGGVLVIDDVSLPAVRRVVDFLLCYPCYELLGSVGTETRMGWKRRFARRLASPFGERKLRSFLSSAICGKIFDDRPNMIALKKRCADERSWNWYVEF